MDRWKRISSGVLLNDDANGYHNARKRVERRNARTSELEDLKNRISKLEQEATHLKEAVKSLSGLCNALTDAVKQLQDKGL